MSIIGTFQREKVDYWLPRAGGFGKKWGVTNSFRVLGGGVNENILKL